MVRRALSLAAAAMLAGFAAPAEAQEIFTGVYAHAVDTPFTFDTGEDGVDVQLGVRFPRSGALALIGRPAPYVLLSVNAEGDTSFAGGGLSWKLGSGPVYVRPEIGVVVHDGPARRIAANGTHTELGSRVLFEPGIAIGTRLTPRLGLEASWVHISQGRLFNAEQNPGIDMLGVRLNLGL